MPTTKNALIRYKVLDQCFRNPGRRYFIQDLMAECEKVLAEISPDSSSISRRQIFDDISFMESKEGWEIELERNREGKKVYYRYADQSFSINNMPLNEVEIQHLKSAIEVLTQFKGMPQFEWINELIPKLRQGAESASDSAVIVFDSNQYLKGIELLGDLYNAAVFKKVLQVKYQPYKTTDISEIIIHPYILRQFNGRWFLFGYNPAHEKSDWILAIDRIEAIREVNHRYEENTEIDWNEYFEDFIGVTRPENDTLEDIILWFTGRTGHYIETKPIHGSQKSKWLDENTLEVRLQLMINYELERYILSYADSVCVKSPPRLIEIVKQRLNLANGQYDT